MKNFKLIRDDIVIGHYNFPTMDGTGLPIVIDMATQRIEGDFKVKGVGLVEYIQVPQKIGVLHEAKFVDSDERIYWLQEMKISEERKKDESTGY